MDPWARFQSDVEALVTALVPTPPPLERPPDPTMGDLAMPCFPLARELRKAPIAIAADLAKAAATKAPTGVRVVAAGPYVNFFADRAAIAAAVLDAPQEVLHPSPSGEKVILEHTSANPNGPLHVGRARNPILGDTLARMYRAAGHDVEVQYYMDNLGRQVALLAWGRHNIDEGTLPRPARAKADHDLVRYYQAANDQMKADERVQAEVQALMARLEAADKEALAMVRPVYEACFAGMRESLTRLGATYDLVKDESDLVEGGDVERLMERLDALPRAGTEEDGAAFLDLSDVLKGQKDKFYYRRRDGTSVYATRDIAYHAWKAERVKGGRLVDVLGEDHRLQSLQVGTALRDLGVKVPDVVFYSFVSLPEGKMSTRANRVVFLDDLLDEAVARAREEVVERRGDELDAPRIDAIAEAVGVAAVRFNIVRIQPEKPIEFQWEEALDFEGDSAPYLMYAHARASSLIEAARAAGIEPRVGPLGEGEVRVLLVVSRWPGLIADAARQDAPQRVAAYALELAAAFHEYYRDHRVVGHADKTEAAMRLAVVVALQEALAVALKTLGIPALLAM